MSYIIHSLRETRHLLILHNLLIKEHTKCTCYRTNYKLHILNMSPIKIIIKVF